MFLSSDHTSVNVLYRAYFWGFRYNSSIPMGFCEMKARKENGFESGLCKKEWRSVGSTVYTMGPILSKIGFIIIFWLVWEFDTKVLWLKFAQYWILTANKISRSPKCYIFCICCFWILLYILHARWRISSFQIISKSNK